MPEPLVQPPRRTVCPSISNSSALRLGRVSVVIIASEKALPCSALSSICRTPASIFSIGSCRPMMPVDEQSTSSFSRSRCAAASSVMRYAFSRPTSPVAQFALPLLTISACAVPPFSRSWQTSTGAAAVLLVVKVAAALHGTSAARIARSLIDASDLIPLATVPARKPRAAVTQLSTSRNSCVTNLPPSTEKVSRLLPSIAGKALAPRKKLSRKLLAALIVQWRREDKQPWTVLLVGMGLASIRFPDHSIPGRSVLAEPDGRKAHPY